MIKIKIWGVITPQTSDVVETAVSSLESTTEPILVVINSMGGIIGDAVAIKNLLRSVPNPVITVALGSCVSAATMIFATGRSRYLGSDITYMLHQPYSVSSGDLTNFSIARDIEQTLRRSLEIYRNSIQTPDVQIPKEILDRVFNKGEDVYLTLRECLKYNIATNRFTTWQDLYKREKLDPEEQGMIYDILVQEEGDELG